MIGMKLSGRLRSAAGVLGRVLGVCAAAVAVSAGLSAEEVTEKFLSEGVTARVGGYRPQRAAMDQEASIIEAS
ncbi:MAG: hypothetical protein ACOVRM_09815 [Planctomycetaceae bacterium]